MTHNVEIIPPHSSSDKSREPNLYRVRCSEKDLDRYVGSRLTAYEVAHGHLNNIILQAQDKEALDIRNLVWYNGGTEQNITPY